jgi:hypothetical protein
MTVKPALPVATDGPDQATRTPEWDQLYRPPVDEESSR